jgi:hypothetical protein
MLVEHDCEFRSIVTDVDAPRAMLVDPCSVGQEA